MNKIRQNWSNNGTPFFFHFQKADSGYIHIDSARCLAYDAVSVTSDGITAMDCLVDIRHIDKSLERCSDPLVISTVKDALEYCINTVNYLVSISEKKGAQR